MHYVIYVSQASTPMTAADLESLLSFSRASNTEKGITGLLIYRFSPDTKSGHFIQMLEGDESAVRALYARIMRDKRHHTILPLAEGESPARMFGEWAMGFKNVDDTLLASLPGHSRIGESTFDAAAFENSNDKALELFRIFHDAP
ncbi:BLUF domain-containing protein [Rhodoplanes sp. SY1]|uniref:BLUF domain-containing protein n=1 Tax=Rhodoplanes sp. SY1 TaxID=3166646 RepID=UPI0038B5CF21